MIAQRNGSTWRALGLAVALLAVTLNFLQPLAHAAAMRDGAPGSPWAAFCNPGAATEDGQPMPPGEAKSHDCCLGLAHAAAVAEPPSDFVTVEPVAARIAPSLPAETTTAAAIRDGPTRPRGPPSLA